jgi:hypothetical protein
MSTHLKARSQVASACLIDLVLRSKKQHTNDRPNFVGGFNFMLSEFPFK